MSKEFLEFSKNAREGCTAFLLEETMLITYATRTTFNDLFSLSHTNKCCARIPPNIGFECIILSIPQIHT